ncbi:hypothetical protein NITLEN_50173 [Nitrospira lenta]|uniref:Uncharacterized protein n=1 Tax=Nitrospira lenta TaxID=1436998 RepID=A0A330L9W8_9BACT|nr:hypothetical protein NITLEN_50173 [Nitrospira lenta]
MVSPYGSQFDGFRGGKIPLDDAVNHRAKVEVVPNGVDPTYFATRSDPQGKTIIFAGN